MCAKGYNSNFDDEGHVFRGMLVRPSLNYTILPYSWFKQDPPARIYANYMYYLLVEINDELNWFLFRKMVETFLNKIAS